MFTRLRILNWLVEVDREATLEVYRELSSGAKMCGCQGCRNFVRSRDRVFPKEFLDILEKLGIDYKKEVEVSDVEDPAFKDKVFFNGWYHACGRILEGVPTPKPPLGQVQELKYIFVDQGCQILIREVGDLASKNFPRPIFQIEFVLGVNKKLFES